MLKKIFSKILSSLPQTLALLFILVFAVFAWQEPSQAPPQENAPAPINVSNADQSKLGGLGLGGGVGQALQWLKNIGGTLHIQNQAGTSNIVIGQDGKVGIGTTSPSAKLDVQAGDVKVGTVTVKGDGTISSDLNSDKLDDYHAADLMAGGGGGGYTECYTLAVGSNADCASGYKAVLTTKGTGCSLSYPANMGLEWWGTWRLRKVWMFDCTGALARTDRSWECLDRGVCGEWTNVEQVACSYTYEGHPYAYAPYASTVALCCR